MKNARQLLEEIIASSFRDLKQAASMFTANGRLVSESGKIKRLREALSIAAVVQGVFLMVCPGFRPELLCLSHREKARFLYR